MKILIQLFLRLLHEKTPYHTLCTIPEAVKLRGSSLLMKLLTKLFLKLPTQLRIKLLTSEAFVTPSPRHSAGSPSEEESSPSCGLKRGHGLQAKRKGTLPWCWCWSLATWFGTTLASEHPPPPSVFCRKP